MENQRISFFSRIKIAVAKLENYYIFLEEKISVSIKYFFLIVFALSIVMAFVETYHLSKMINKAYDYIENDLSDFSYEDGKLNFEKEVYAYDKEYDTYFIANTGDDISNEMLQEYQSKIKSRGIILLKNKAILVSNGANAEYPYDKFIQNYNINSMTKEELIKKIQEIGMMGIYATIFIILLVSLYIIQIFSTLMDWFIISLFALISTKICKVNMTYKQCFNISIYALTLPIILTMLYNVAYYLAGFYTDYFRTIYLLITYIYVVAAILLIKSNAIKERTEVTKIVEIQKETNESEKDKEDENNVPDKENKDEKQDKKEDEQNNTEPDGSEI